MCQLYANEIPSEFIISFLFRFLGSIAWVVSAFSGPHMSILAWLSLHTHSVIYLRYRRWGRNVMHIYFDVLSFRYPFGSWQSLNGRIVATAAHFRRWTAHIFVGTPTNSECSFKFLYSSFFSSLFHAFTYDPCAFRNKQTINIDL